MELGTSRSRSERWAVALTLGLMAGTGTFLESGRLFAQDGEARSRGVELAIGPLQAEALDARVARLVALYVPAGKPPTPFVPAGPFQAVFSGSIDLDLNDSFRFRLIGTGRARLSIGGKVVLDAPSLLVEGVATEDEVRLRKGANELELIYRSPEHGDSQLRLLWSNSELPEEPVPPEALSHGVSEHLFQGSARRARRQRVAEANCWSCHRPASARAFLHSRAPPTLAGTGNVLQPGWVERYLVDPRAWRPGARMPELLSLDNATARQEAADIAEYLDSWRLESATYRLGDSAQGALLYTQLGCAACHERSSDSEDGRAPPLVGLVGKWKPSGLIDFLIEPRLGGTRNHSAMPDFWLEPAEAEALAAHLFSSHFASGSQSENGDCCQPSGLGDIERGRRLVKQLGCEGCHDAPSADIRAPDLSEIAASPLSWKAPSEAGDSGFRHPRYDFRPVESRAVEAFFREDLDSLARFVEAEQAEDQIAFLGCTACHARDGVAGRWASLPAAKQLAIEAEDRDTLTVDLAPPDLTWTGEKLKVGWLDAYVEGRIEDRPLSYSALRMPSFPVLGDPIAEGLRHQHGLPATDPEEEPIDPELVEIGADLVKADRLGCRSCHAAGEEDALGGSGSTETINFDLMHRRLRRDFFDRFLRDPQRILPGSKMPQFVDEDGYSALYDVFDGDAERQFEAIWQYLRSLPH